MFGDILAFSDLDDKGIIYRDVRHSLDESLTLFTSVASLLSQFQNNTEFLPDTSATISNFPDLLEI